MLALFRGMPGISSNLKDRSVARDANKSLSRERVDRFNQVAHNFSVLIQR